LLLTFTFPEELKSSYNGLANETLAVSSCFLEKSSKNFNKNTHSITQAVKEPNSFRLKRLESKNIDG